MRAENRFAADDTSLPQQQLSAANARSMLLTWRSEGARLEFGNLGLLTPDFRAVHDVEVLSIILGNHDWVCLSSDVGEGDLSSLAQQLSSLP